MYVKDVGDVMDIEVAVYPPDCATSTSFTLGEQQDAVQFRVYQYR
jgi:hypothetical protein